MNYAKILNRGLGLSVLLIFITINLVPAPSFGYALTATYIFNRLVKNHEHLRTLEMEGKISDLSNKTTFREITNIDFSTGKIHSLYLNDAGENLGEKTSKILESHPLGMAWFGLGGDSNVARVQTILGLLGITTKDDNNVKLTRIQTRPVFEIGSGAMVRIEKEDFQFAAYQTESKDAIEVESYSTGAAVKLPKLITFKKADSVVYTYELKSFKMNTPYKPPQKPGTFHALSASLQGWNDLVH
jgi:hypothetical protein